MMFYVDEKDCLVSHTQASVANGSLHSKPRGEVTCRTRSFSRTLLLFAAPPARNTHFVTVLKPFFVPCLLFQDCPTNALLIQP